VRRLAAIDGVAAVAPQITTSQLVIAGSKNTTTTIIGTTADYAQVRNETLYQGSFLNNAAVDNSLRDAVVGATTAQNLGLTASAVGTDVTIGGLPFRIVGLLEPKGGIGSQDDPDPRAVERRPERVRGRRHS